MADAAGEKYDLIEELLERGNRFSLVQVLRLLDAARLQTESGGEAGVRVVSKLAMAFPCADVDRVTREKPSLFQVTATCLGLYGTDSPLPNYYTEDLMYEKSSEITVNRDFLDILHQRLYQLLFQCWQKYRLFYRVAEANDTTLLNCLYCLIGLGDDQVREGMAELYGMLRYAPVFSMLPRSAAGLESVLRDVLQVEVKVIQCVRRMAQFEDEQRLRLGKSGCRLGIDSVIGQEAPDAMGKFRLRIGPLDREHYLALLPGEPLHRKMCRLVRFYLSRPLVYEVELVLSAGALETVQLGNPDRARLGLNTRCFSGPCPGAIRPVFQTED